MVHFAAQNTHRDAVGPEVASLTPTAYLCVRCDLRAGDCACDGPTFRFAKRAAIEAADRAHGDLLKAARDLCDALVSRGFGTSSERALPGEYDTLRDAILKATTASAVGTTAEPECTQQPRKEGPSQ